MGQRTLGISFEAPRVPRSTAENGAWPQNIFTIEADHDAHRHGTMGGEDSRRRAEAATFAWSTLQKTVREYPAIGVLLAVAAPLLGAAGIFLLPLSGL